MKMPEYHLNAEERKELQINCENYVRHYAELKRITRRSESMHHKYLAQVNHSRPMPVRTSQRLSVVSACSRSSSTAQAPAAGIGPSTRTAGHPNVLESKRPSTSIPLPCGSPRASSRRSSSSIESLTEYARTDLASHHFDLAIHSLSPVELFELKAKLQLHLEEDDDDDDGNDVTGGGMDSVDDLTIEGHSDQIIASAEEEDQ